MSTSRTFASTQHLIGLLVVTARLIQEQVANRLSALGVSYSQAVTLVRLYRSDHGVMNQSDLIEALAVSRASGTLLLSQLEARGLITRAGDPGDARRLVVSLTASGRSLEPEVFQVFDEVESVIRRSLGQAEIDGSFEALRRMFDDIWRHRSTGA